MFHIRTTGVWVRTEGSDIRILWFHETAKTRIMIAACLFCVHGFVERFAEWELTRIIIIINMLCTSKWTQIGEWVNRWALDNWERRCEKVLMQSASLTSVQCPNTIAGNTQVAVWTMHAQGTRVHDLTNGRWFSWNYKRFIINKVLKSLHTLFLFYFFHFIFALVIYVIFSLANIHFH